MQILARGLWSKRRSTSVSWTMRYSWSWSQTRKAPCVHSVSWSRWRPCWWSVSDGVLSHVWSRSGAC